MNEIKILSSLQKLLIYSSELISSNMFTHHCCCHAHQQENGDGHYFANGFGGDLLRSLVIETLQWLPVIIFHFWQLHLDAKEVSFIYMVDSNFVHWTPSWIQTKHGCSIPHFHCFPSHGISLNPGPPAGSPSPRWMGTSPHGPSIPLHLLHHYLLSFFLYHILSLCEKMNYSRFHIKFFNFLHYHFDHLHLLHYIIVMIEIMSNIHSIIQAISTLQTNTIIAITNPFISISGVSCSSML